MALRAGERLGPYEILGGLGAGGMGEVYRARDPRLGRAVAIKVLPAAVSADPSRRHRFEHEARAAGQLNHPNVLAVYDVGDHEGAPYLVTELLEGETLRERLQVGALPVRQAADHALQAARGLAVVHDKGIVHRDLKPENLFLTKNGLVKILDFGLARLERAPEPGSEATATATSGTEPGTVMGTVGYMSPEQVRGEAADHRSDLFALGAVLYEMLTGRRAFRRDSSVETLNAILKEEPEECPPDRQVPPALARLVRHCLAKKADDRFQSARDLAFELEGVTGSSVNAARAAAPVIGRWRRRLAGTAAGVAVLAALAGAFFAGRRTASPNIPSYHQITFGRGLAPSGRLTPDGKTVVYSAAWNGGPPEIYTARTDAPEARLLGLPHGHVLSISSQGELAILLTEYPVYPERPATLARVPFSGGTPRPVAENVVCADWAPDGETLAMTREVDGQRRIEFPLGRVLAQGSGCPRFSPDGRRLAFGTKDGYQGIELASGKEFRVTGATGYVHEIYWEWSPREDEIWFTGSDRVEERPIRAVSLSGRQRVLDRIAGAASLYDVSRDGLALIEHAFARWAVRARGPGEAGDRDVSVFDRTSPCDISTDGRRVLLFEWGAAAGERSSAYLGSTDGSPPMRVDVGGATALSPDGRWVLFPNDEEAAPSGVPRRRLLLVPTGTGEPQTVPQGELRVSWATWTPDGRRILVAGREHGKGLQVFVQGADGGGWRAVTPEGVFPQLLATRVPVPVGDDHQVAVPAPNGRLTLYRLDGGGEPREVPGVGPGFVAVRFATDGRSLFVAGPEATPTRVYRVDLVTGRRTLLHELMPADTAGVTTFEQAFVTPDGRSYAYPYRQILQQLYVVEGLR
jgi:Tol biopolymer transport system component